MPPPSARVLPRSVFHIYPPPFPGPGPSSHGDRFPRVSEPANPFTPKGSEPFTPKGSALNAHPSATRFPQGRDTPWKDPQ